MFCLHWYLYTMCIPFAQEGQKGALDLLQLDHVPPGWRARSRRLPHGPLGVGALRRASASLGALSLPSALSGVLAWGGRPFSGGAAHHCAPAAGPGRAGRQRCEDARWSRSLLETAAPLGFRGTYTPPGQLPPFKGLVHS